MNYQMPYYNFPPYKYTPSMYQINMFNPETGQAVNSSTVFYRQEDVNWYLACVSNLGSIFKIIVCYQNCVWKNKYEYEIQQGRYIYHPPPVEYAQPPEFVFQGTQTENIDTEVPVSTEVANETEVPVSTEVADETDGNPLNVTYNNHATSGFNFHFDPPTNLNLVINPTTSIESDRVSEDDNLNQDNYNGYDENGEGEQDDYSNEGDPNYNPADDINELLHDVEDDFEATNFEGTSTPPPVDEDHWDIVQNDETYEEMLLEKYGRGYLLKTSEDHPDYGIKYYPSEENCRAWWQDTNQGWFVQRENKNYFLERGAIFVHHNGHKKRHRKRNKRQRF